MIDSTPKVPILIVDDRPENLIALQAVFSNSNYRLLEASSGMEAVKLAEDHEFAAILLDVQMPIMDGFEAAHRLRNNPLSKNTPIIFITASLEDGERIYRGYQAGAVDYIFKPFDPLILRSKVSVLVELYNARKEIERQGVLLRLQESKERESFLEFALDAVVGMDSDGHVNYWNLQAEKIFGWSKPEAMGLRMSELIIPVDYRLLHETGLKRFLETGEGPILRKRIEVTALKKDGTEFTVELAVIPMKIDGKINFSAFVRDISDRIKADEEKRAEQEKLQKALHARDEFISICSHELKTPLTSMKLQFQLAAKQFEKNDPTMLTKEHSLKRIHSSSLQLDRMARLIDDMLDVSRIASGKLIMKPQPVELQKIVEETLERFSEQLSTLKIPFTVRGLEVSRKINGDAFRLEQVITNLLTNAIKYGKGSLIEIELEAHGGVVRLTVKDQGLGIAKENIATIFERYERAIPSNNISGLGLGLYITKQIVDAHQGRISVESEINKGSTFIVEFTAID